MTRKEMKFPWSIQDTIENLKELKVILQEQLKRKNYEGQGERDSKEIGLDFDRAIDALEKDCSDCTRRKFYQEGYQDGLNADKWISCSERLPKSNGCYLVWRPRFFGGEIGMPAICYFDGQNTWHDAYGVNFARVLNESDVVAWQPLPEPYKEGET